MKESMFLSGINTVRIIILFSIKIQISQNSQAIAIEEPNRNFPAGPLAFSFLQKRLRYPVRRSPLHPQHSQEYNFQDSSYYYVEQQTLGASGNPVRIGFSQQLFGYNQYKWLSKIAPANGEPTTSVNFPVSIENKRASEDRVDAFKFEEFLVETDYPRQPPTFYS
ncbi:MAG: hypothetical protein WDZ47_02120 [Bacteroidales bacterium]